MQDCISESETFRTGGGPQITEAIDSVHFLVLWLYGDKTFERHNVQTNHEVLQYL